RGGQRRRARFAPATARIARSSRRRSVRRPRGSVAGAHTTPRRGADRSRPAGARRLRGRSRAARQPDRQDDDPDRRHGLWPGRGPAAVDRGGLRRAPGEASLADGSVDFDRGVLSASAAHAAYTIGHVAGPDAGMWLSPTPFVDSDAAGVVAFART